MADLEIAIADHPSPLPPVRFRKPLLSRQTLLVVTTLAASTLVILAPPPAVSAQRPVGQQGGGSASATPAPTTDTLKCPAGDAMSLEVSAAKVPSGWIGSGLVPVLTSAEIVPGITGKAELECSYGPALDPQFTILRLRYEVETGACTLAPDRKSFLCRPGSTTPSASK